MQIHDWLLTPARAAIHTPTRTAVVADLHLGYDRVRHRGGEAVPIRALAHLLDPLTKLDAQRLVIAGDLFEDARCQREALISELEAWLLQHQIDLVAIVPGNHDRGLSKSALPLYPEGYALGDWLVVHGDRELPEGQVIQGHEHPWLRWRPGVEGPCYLASPTHLVLPAYSRDAAGVNVLGQSRWASYRCGVIAEDEVLDFGELGRLAARSLRK